VKLFARTLVFGSIFSAFIWAAPIIPFLLRPLPTANLNEAAGENRSNNSFSESDPTARYNGDVFGLPGNFRWRIHAVRTWSVASVLGEALGQEFAEMSLYGRPRPDVMQVIATGSPNDFFELDDPTLVKNSNPNITHRQVTYKNGSNYEGVGTPGVFYPLWEHTFTKLNWVVPGRTPIDFAVWGVGTAQDDATLYGFWFNHVSNRRLSGVPQLQAFNGIWIHDFLTPEATGFRRDVGEAGLWDKGADMNIILFAQPIPEPGALLLVGAGLAALLASRRYRKV
jgi:hypothetical protein